MNTFDKKRDHNFWNVSVQEIERLSSMVYDSIDYLQNVNPHYVWIFWIDNHDFIKKFNYTLPSFVQFGWILQILVQKFGQLIYIFELNQIIWFNFLFLVLIL